jgi:hypothetical protein
MHYAHPKADVKQIEPMAVAQFEFNMAEAHMPKPKERGPLKETAANSN